MARWLKEYWLMLVIGLVLAGLVFFNYSCEPTVKSIIEPDKVVNRAELQLELDRLMALAQIRMADLEKQQELRSLILQNAVLLAQGNAFNPVGIITALAAIYGVTEGGKKVTKRISNRNNRKGINNGTG